MSSLVQQLQQDALDQNVPVADLLRKAKFVATKLAVEEATEWIESELNGYSDQDETPPYRRVMGVPKALNATQGWLPIYCTNDDEFQTIISELKFTHSISEIASLAGSSSMVLYIPLHAGQMAILADLLKIKATQMGVFYGRGQMIHILNVVRNTVLDWALRLENAGIKGDGMSFSSKEKAQAHNSSVINNFHDKVFVSGVQGSVVENAAVSSTQITKSQIVNLTSLVEQIEKLRDQITLNENQNVELTAQLKALRDELSKDQPDSGKISGAMKSIKRIAEGVTGNLVASGIVSLIDKALKLM